MGSSVMTILAMNWYTMLGNLDRAYQAAETGLDGLLRTGTIGVGWGGLWLPEMLPFRQDLRFQGFATRLGLMDFWGQHGPPDNCELHSGVLSCR